jgi:hypothetical protein
VGAVSSGPAVCARDARAHDVFARVAGSRGDVTIGGWHRGTGPGRTRAPSIADSPPRRPDYSSRAEWRRLINCDARSRVAEETDSRAAAAAGSHSHSMLARRWVHVREGKAGTGIGRTVIRLGVGVRRLECRPQPRDERGFEPRGVQPAGLQRLLQLRDRHRARVRHREERSRGMCEAPPWCGHSGRERRERAI